MGIREFFKKLFNTDPNRENSFGEKLNEAGKQIEKVGDRMHEKVKPVFDQMERSAEDLSKRVADDSKELLHRIAEVTEKAGDKVSQTGEQAWEGLKETGQKIADGEHVKKAGQFIERTGEQVIDTADKLWKDVKSAGEQIAQSETAKKAGELAEELGSKILDGAQKTWESIKEKAENLSEKLHEAQEKSADPASDPFKKYSKSHEETSHLDELKKNSGFGSGSFFDKASKFADGDYDAVRGDRLDTNIDKPSAEPKAWQGGEIPGFEDRDGDGDPLIDDAEIIDDNEK